MNNPIQNEADTLELRRKIPFRSALSEGAARIEVLIPAVEAGLQRRMLVMQPADNQLTRSLLTVASGGASVEASLPILVAA